MPRLKIARRHRVSQPTRERTNAQELPRPTRCLVGRTARAPAAPFDATDDDNPCAPTDEELPEEAAAPDDDHLIVTLNAIGGAIWGLAGAKDVPREWLAGTPFDSYVVPSLILLVVVGGSMFAAATASILRLTRAPELAIAAGLVLMGWIVVQMAIIVPDGGFSWLQPTMFALGALVAWLGGQLRSARGRPGCPLLALPGPAAP